MSLEMIGDMTGLEYTLVVDEGDTSNTGSVVYVDMNSEYSFRLSIEDGYVMATLLGGGRDSIAEENTIAELKIPIEHHNNNHNTTQQSQH